MVSLDARVTSGGLSFHAMDAAIAQLIASYDISHGVDMFAAKRCNILVGDLKRFDDLISATVFEAPLCNLVNWNGEAPVEKPTDRQIMFECPSTIFDEIISQSRVLLFDIELQAQRGNMPTNVLYAEITGKSIIIPWGTVTTNFWMLDLCCGGYGGWQYGFHIMEKYGLPFHYCIGIDHDLPMCTMHAINHHTALIPDEKIPDDFFLHNKMHSTIHASINSDGWKQAVATIRPDRWFFSFPCQSCTTSANARGFGDGNGQVFLHGMMNARIFRPKTIGLENVQGFPNHREFPLALQIIRHCGYRIVHQGIYDAADRLPTRRVRWIALLERIEEDPHVYNWQSWGDSTKSSPMTWNAWFPTNPTEFSDFGLQQQHRDLYMDPAFLPAGAPKYASDNIHRYRVPQICMKTPVFMASYGEHHCLPEEFLRSKGLHGFFAAEHFSIRWYQPAEIALLHMQLHDMVLLAPKATSWKALGNSIVIHHALLVIANLLNYEFPKEVPIQIEDIIQQIENSRLKASEVSLTKDDYAWYLGKETEIQKKQTQLHFLATTMGWEGDPNPTWKPKVFFHPQHGCMPLTTIIDTMSVEQVQISPTIPFALQEEPEIDQSDLDMPFVEWDPYQFTEQECTMESDFKQSDQFVAITLDVAPHNYGKLWASKELQIGPLLQIWGARFIPNALQTDEASERSLDYSHDVCETTLIPYVDANCQINGLVIDEPSILMVDKSLEMQNDDNNDEEKTIALKIPYDNTWTQMLEKFPFLQDFCFDDFGLIPDGFKPDNHMRVAKFVPKILPVILTKDLLQAMDDTRVECHMLPRADNMVIVLYGSPIALPALVKTLATCM